MIVDFLQSLTQAFSENRKSGFFQHGMVIGSTPVGRTGIFFSEYACVTE